MMPRLKSLILRLLDEHRLMTVATNRPDGWPQATTVGYVNDGYLLYCFIARNAQKYANIRRDRRVSIAIGSDAPNPFDIKGLSLAGQADEVTDRDEFDYIARLRLKRFPEYSMPARSLSNAAALDRIAPEPSPANVVLLRIAPDVISVLDYSKGFGHSDLVTFSANDLDVHLSSARHRWNGFGEAGAAKGDGPAQADVGGA
jgi:general stress protein 26